MVCIKFKSVKNANIAHKLAGAITVRWGCANLDIYCARALVFIYGFLKAILRTSL